MTPTLQFELKYKLLDESCKVLGYLLGLNVKIPIVVTFNCEIINDLNEKFSSQSGHYKIDRLNKIL